MGRTLLTDQDAIRYMEAISFSLSKISKSLDKLVELSESEPETETGGRDPDMPKAPPPCPENCDCMACAENRYRMEHPHPNCRCLTDLIFKGGYSALTDDKGTRE